jgi:hypothetical protein
LSSITTEERKAGAKPGSQGDRVRRHDRDDQRDAVRTEEEGPTEDEARRDRLEAAEPRPAGGLCDDEDEAQQEPGREQALAQVRDARRRAHRVPGEDDADPASGDPAPACEEEGDERAGGGAKGDLHAEQVAAVAAERVHHAEEQGVERRADRDGPRRPADQVGERAPVRVRVGGDRGRERRHVVAAAEDREREHAEADRRRGPRRRARWSRGLRVARRPQRPAERGDHAERDRERGEGVRRLVERGGADRRGGKREEDGAGPQPRDGRASQPAPR